MHCNTINQIDMFTQKAITMSCLAMYYPFRREEKLKGKKTSLKYSQKFNESEVATVISQNRRLIEPHAELAVEAYETM